MSSTTKDAKAQREEKKARAREIIAARQQEREDERRAQAELEAIAREEAAEREEEARREAADRNKAISRAAGGLATAYEQDQQAIFDAAQAFAELVARANARYRQLADGLAAESGALVDRFGVAPAKLPAVVAPDQSEKIVAAMRLIRALSFVERALTAPATEQCEHRLRTRRSYAEVAGTPAFEIIARVGPKPFPELNERQREIVAERQREQEQERENMRSIGPLARETTAALDLVSASRLR